MTDAAVPTANVRDVPRDFVPRNRDEAGALVWGLSQSKADAVLAAEALADDLEGMHALTDAVSRDYAGRFVAELIQNAHDAHPAGRRNGEIEIILDRTGRGPGTLYVANKGKPFDFGDVRSISVLAKSTKTPGQGIGNKGVGFKAVFLVTESPEIYSTTRNSSNGDFDGFCFGFAQPEDYLALAGGNPDMARSLAERRHKSGLPVPIEGAIDPTVMLLASRGHRVVVRLPIRPEAQGDVEAQIRDLRRGDVPVLLFLERINALRIEVRHTDSTEASVLTRSVQQVESLPGASIDRIRLGTHGTYWRASTVVAQERFKSALQASVDAGKIDARWLEWSEPAIVSVAIRSDAEHEDDRLYSFLPMGKGERSPFHGHVNAPFSVAIARKALVEDAPLNDLLLDVAAEVCLRVAPTFAMRAETRRVAADLIAWKGEQASVLLKAADKLGINLGEQPLLPVLPAPVLASIMEAWDWPFALAVLTPDGLAHAGVSILEADLSADRIQRIGAFALAAFGRPMVPDAVQVAAWTELVASQLAAASRVARGPFDPKPWLKFYDDLAALEKHFDGLASAVSNRRILIDDDLALTPCGPARAMKQRRREFTAFFRPGSDADEDADLASDLIVPASLHARFSFPHSGLRWVDPDSSTRSNRPGREFLERAGVKTWRLEDLFPEIRAILIRTSDARVFADALRFVYAAHRRNDRSRSVDVRLAGLHVPTESGWLPATDVRFGAGWNGTLGPRLAQLTKLGAPDSELGRIRRQLLRPFDGRRYKGDLAEWIGFLRRTGVKDGLEPEDLLPRQETRSKVDFRPAAVADRLGLLEDERSAWVQAVEKIPPPTRRSPWTMRGPVWRIPGQSGYSGLSPGARRLFAELVLDGLGGWAESLLSFSVESTEWPTPAGLFLHERAWLPTARPSGGNPAFATPAGTWHYIDDDGGLPTYAPLLLKQFRTQLLAEPRLWARLSGLGVREWGDPANAGARLRVLAGLVAAGIPDAQRPFLRRAYERSWASVIQEGAESPWSDGEPPEVVVTTLERLGVLFAARSRGKLYVLSTPDPLAESILDDRAIARLRVDPRDGSAAAALLRPHLLSRLVEIGVGDITVSIGQKLTTPRASDPLLVTAERSWLADLLTLTLEILLQADVTTQSISRAVARLRRVRVRHGLPIHVGVRNTELGMSVAPAQVVPIDHERWPTLVVAGAVDSLADGLSWTEMEAMAPAIADLVGYQSAQMPLRFVTSKLADGRTGRVSAPTVDEYARAFGARRERVRDVLDANRATLHQLAFVLRPVITFWFGARGQRAFDTGDDEPLTEQAIIERLSVFLFPGGMTASRLVLLAREAESPAALRDVLKLPFGGFNQVLGDLGAPYGPSRDPGGHAASFAAYVEDHREEITRALRSAALPMFDQMAIPAWFPASLQEVDRVIRLETGAPTDGVPELSPDSAWLDEMPRPSRVVIGERVSAWLADLGVRVAPPRVPGIRRFDQTRSGNATVADGFWRANAATIAAWCASHETTAPSWVTDGPRGLSLKLLPTGVLDFRRLDQAALLSWLVIVPGLWPLGMPHAIDAESLGLSVAEIADWHRTLGEAAGARSLPRRTVKLDDVSVSLDPGDVDRLVGLVDQDLSDSLALYPPEVVHLDEPPEVRTARGRSGRGMSGGRRDSQLTDAQKLVVGFIGELVVFRWLTQHFDATPDAWRSSLGLNLFPHLSVDDSLGFDFTILDRGKLTSSSSSAPKQVFLEAKAVGAPRIGQPLAIHFTEGEVECAREHSDDGSYFVVLVVNALDSTRRAIRVLPNPFSADGQRVFRDISAGRTLLFNLPEGP